MRKRLLSLALLLGSTALLQAQTWFTVTVNNESTGLSATMPAGATYDWGCVKDSFWSAPVTVAALTPGITSWMLGSPANTLKDTANPTCGDVLRVQETAAPQTVLLMQNGSVVGTIHVPALPPPPPPAALPAFTITFTGATITLPTSFVINDVQGYTYGNATDSAGNIINFLICVQPMGTLGNR